VKIIGLEYFSLDELEVSEFNVRKIELTKESLTPLLDSILEVGGIIEPIIVTKDKKIVAGRRRFEASKLAKLEKIPCLVMEFDGARYENDSDVEKIVVSFIENKVTQALIEDEEISAINKMRKRGQVIQKIANLLGVPSYYIGELSARSKKPPAFRLTEREKEEVEETPVQSTLDEKTQKKIELDAKFKKLERKEPRKYRLVRRLLNKTPYKTDIYEAAKLLELAQKGTLRMIEDIEKDVKAKAPPNLDFRIKVAENKEGYLLRQIRIPKVLNTVVSAVCRRAQYDFYDFVIQA